ncbi:MAG: enoyl-CoA hydratase-related protein [Ahrensia sp.]|nr:enoyl-CoA hydratase-related protein [Ahrensia sp.]
MSDDVLRFETDGSVATLTLNRPKQFNALDADLRRALRETTQRVEDDPAIRVAIIKGEGRGFCAGADLSAGLEKPVSEHIEREYKPSLETIADGNTIWIAQVHGVAAGIGAAYAMNCDLVTMADDATVYMAFAAIALIPDGGNTQLLLSHMGYHRALQAILEGRKIPADECLQYGIANKVFTPEELNASTLEWAKSIADGAPLSMGAAKRLLRKVGRLNYGAAISAEGLEQNTLTESEDFTTGVNAFFTKEKPNFQGK